VWPYLLELKLDGRLNLSHLSSEILVVRDGRRELASLGETWTQETRDLLDQGVASKEGVILARKLLDQLLVLVELLEIIGRHGIDAMVLGSVDIVLVTEDAKAHAGTGNGRKLDGARETLVTLGVLLRVSVATWVGVSARLT
jgi:hypothetical protein